jgi:hypothetical protein
MPAAVLQKIQRFSQPDYECGSSHISTIRSACSAPFTHLHYTTIIWLILRPISSGFRDLKDNVNLQTEHVLQLSHVKIYEPIPVPARSKA